MKHGKSLLCLLLALLLLTGCAPAAQSPAPAETQQTAEPQAAAAEEPAAPEQSAEQQPEQSDTITVTDHNDNVVTVPRRIDRIVVCDILPLPSVLSVFFDRQKIWSASRRRACLPRRTACFPNSTPKF